MPQARAMRTYTRAWDCLMIAMILLYVLAWVWFPTTMAIWTTSSFIATAIYVVVRLQLRRNAKKRPRRWVSSCLTVEGPRDGEERRTRGKGGGFPCDDARVRQGCEGMSEPCAAHAATLARTTDRRARGMALTLWLALIVARACDG